MHKSRYQHLLGISWGARVVSWHSRGIQQTFSWVSSSSCKTTNAITVTPPLISVTSQRPPLKIHVNLGIHFPTWAFGGHLQTTTGGQPCAHFILWDNKQQYISPEWRSPRWTCREGEGNRTKIYPGFLSDLHPMCLITWWWPFWVSSMCRHECCPDVLSNCTKPCDLGLLKTI
jgi:hypothetical protein